MMAAPLLERRASMDAKACPEIKINSGSGQRQKDNSPKKTSAEKQLSQSLEKETAD
jgi:hypothetical protein